MIERFNRYAARLREVAPGELEKAAELAARVRAPASSDADSCWGSIWDKPLFANTRVAVAEAKCAALAPSMPGAWRTIGVPGGDYEVTRVGKGSKASSFEVRGAFAKRIRAVDRVAAHRLLAIQGAASALRARAARAPSAPYADLVGMPIGARVRTVLGEMGHFWGHITVMHMLTDLGLCCKPDLHLVRTARALGIAIGVPKGRSPNLRHAVVIAEAVWEVAVRLHGAPTPQQFRHLDKVMMEISRKGLLGSDAAASGGTP